MHKHAVPTLTGSASPPAAATPAWWRGVAGGWAGKPKGGQRPLGTLWLRSGERGQWPTWAAHARGAPMCPAGCFAAPQHAMWPALAPHLVAVGAPGSVVTVQLHADRALGLAKRALEGVRVRGAVLGVRAEVHAQRLLLLPAASARVCVCVPMCTRVHARARAHALILLSSSARACTHLTIALKSSHVGAVSVNHTCGALAVPCVGHSMR